MLIPRFAFLLIASIWSVSTVAQTNKPIRLNRHYFEIPSEDSTNHVYNKTESFTKDSVKLERFFTLNNTINRIVRTSKLREEFQEEITEQYDAFGDLIWKRTHNLVNGKFLTTYFFDGVQVAQVLHEGNNKFQIIRSGELEPTEKIVNDFEPRSGTTQRDWSQFLNKKLQFGVGNWPSEKQTVYIQVYVSENGNVTSAEWANPMGADEKYAHSFLEAVKEWDHNFSPAIDPFGNPVGKWVNFHFHVGGPARIGEIIFR
jgi:hypothetical protein